MVEKVLSTADILIPQIECMNKWGVVACDQYTSEPAYWEGVKQLVGNSPSTYNMVFPEIYLKNAGFDDTIKKINMSMQRYLDENIFALHPSTYVFVERTLFGGKIRHGIIGKIDLEDYDFKSGSKTPIRATEGTVLDRIPPRVQIRKDAPLELPHIMLLIDDEEGTVIEPIAKCIDNLTPIYDFQLMQNSGSIRGFDIPQRYIDQIDKGFAALCDPDYFNARYGTNESEVLLFAVGDGNHSLATAKKCYDNLKQTIGEKALSHPSRYALVEVVNLHDSSLEFEAIHRMLFDVDTDHLLKCFGEYFQLSDKPVGQRVDIIKHGAKETVYITNPTRNLAVGSLQEFLDNYLSKNAGEIDYIHGEDVVTSLSSAENSVGFVLQGMNKNDLFKTVILDGALPRKTFSMGDACDKRFYLESRRIFN